MKTEADCTFTIHTDCLLSQTESCEDYPPASSTLGWQDQGQAWGQDIHPRV